MERGESGESISSLTRARAAVWQPGDGGKEVAVVALGADGALAREEENDTGRIRGGGWRSSPLL
jgi:hypothetical protein